MTVHYYFAYVVLHFWPASKGYNDDMYEYLIYFSQKLLRFSVAVSDFFVPNKTLYKDYIEFIKVKYYGKKSTLPSVYF